MNEIFSLAALLNEPGVVLDEENPFWLSEFIVNAGDLDFLAKLEPLLSDPSRPAVENFGGFENSTLLFLMNLIPRKNYRNRYPSGMQQSYGDHNRLLMLGIDKLCAGDWRWFLPRSVFHREAFVVDLENYVAGMRDRLRDDRQLRKLLVLAAAFHDYGKLNRRKFGLDSYDAIFLLQRILNQICATPEERAATEFCIRYHDIVEHVGNGAVPIQAVITPYEHLSPEYRKLSWVALSMIQVAGAASLGNGRLTETKLFLGNILATGRFLEQSADHVVRINRLLFPGMAAEDKNLIDMSTSQLARRKLDQPEFVEFCTKVTIRNWGALKLARTDIDDSRIHKCFDRLELLFQIWSSQKNFTDLILLDDDISEDAVQAGTTLAGDQFITIGSAVRSRPGTGRIRAKPHSESPIEEAVI